MVEAYSPDMEFDGNSLVVALTPEACYRLDKAGLVYSMIEDYYDETELLSQEDEHYQYQLRWIDELDGFLQDNVKELKELDLRLGSLYYYHLKRMVLDPLYVRCYTLRKLFDKVEPSEVTFVSRSAESTATDFMLEDVNRSYYSYIIPIYCSQRDVGLTAVLLEDSDGNRKRARLGALGGNFGGRIRRTVATNENLRRIYFAYRYLSDRPSFRESTQQKLNILILRSGYNIWPALVIEGLKRGHAVYELSNELLVKHSFLGAKRDFRLPKDSVSLDSIWEHTASLLEGGDLIRSINERYELDVSEVILPRLRYFVSTICPETLGYFKVFVLFFQGKRFDSVLAPYPYSLVEYAALAAANHQGLNTACLVHGDSVYANKAFRIFEIDNFSIVIYSSRERKEYFECSPEASNTATELYTSPHRVSNIKRIGQLREKRGNRIKKGRIVYLSALLLWDRRRIESGAYPDTWYYRFQKSIVEYLSTKTEYTFVWKGIPAADVIYNPIPLFIADNRYGNIEVATNAFVEHLPHVDRVICDHPSTGFYESIVAGVPTMSLYHEALNVRVSALAYFGRMLKPFSDISEAIKHIDEFLDSDPESYKTTVEMGDESVIAILERVAKNSDEAHHMSPSPR